MTMKSADLSRAVDIITWHRRVMNVMGIWPMKARNIVFFFFMTYLSIHCILAVIGLTEHFDDFEYVSASISENVFLAMALVKICICRFYRKDIKLFLTSMQEDFSPSTYRDTKEKEAFLIYNDMAIKFMKISIPVSGFTGTVYYLKLFLQPLIDIDSVSENFILPYRIHPMAPLDDPTVYTCVCIYQSVVIVVVTCGYAGADSFLVSLCFHVCGQLAALSCRARTVLRKEPEKFHLEIEGLIARHCRLIGLAEILEDRFNFIFLQQLVGTTFLLCLTSFCVLLTQGNSGQTFTQITFVMFCLCVMGTFFVYCYVGECLINESTALCEAIYNSEWYNIAPKYSKLMQLPMLRSRKPLTLTTGKFCVLCLSTFTDIVKTSMAYLSVLRNTM